MSQIPLFISTDAVRLIRWARALPGGGVRKAVYRPDGLEPGEFREREAIEFLGRERWEWVKHELGRHFYVGEDGEGVPRMDGGHGMIYNFTWGCWRLTKVADVVPADDPMVVAL